MTGLSEAVGASRVAGRERWRPESATGPADPLPGRQARPGGRRRRRPPSGRDA